MMIMIKSK